MKRFFENIRDTVALYPEVKRARAVGASAVSVRPVWERPKVKTRYVGFLNTVEGCVLHNCGKAVFGPTQAVFDAFPYDLQHQLSFTPKPGQLMERVAFWKAALIDTVPAPVYHKAMAAILRWYRIIRYGQIADAGEYIAFRERVEGRRLGEREREIIFMNEAQRRARA